jgi:hypothetical protein
LKSTSTQLTTNENNPEIIVWPNPFKNELNIETSAQFESCKLINMKGVVVLSTSETIIDTKQLENGLFVLIIQTDKAKYEFKIMKK